MHNCYVRQMCLASSWFSLASVWAVCQMVVSMSAPAMAGHSMLFSHTRTLATGHIESGWVSAIRTHSALYLTLCYQSTWVNILLFTVLKVFFRSIYCFCLPCQYMDTKRIQMKLLFYLPITRLRKSDFSLRFVNKINTKVTGPDNNPVPECIGVHCVWLSGCVPGLGPLSAGFISDGWGQCPVCHCMSSSHSSGPPSHWHLSRQAVSHVVWDHMQMSCIHVCSPIRTGHKTCKQLLAYEALNNINTASLSPYSPHSHLKQTTN